MYRDDLVVRTKLMPPRRHKHTLHRPRVTGRLLESLDYRLTVVQAATGYGKSTALAALADREVPLAWYRLDAQDADSLVFLLHLLHSFRIAVPDMSERALAALEGWRGSASLAGHGSALPWKTVVGLMVNELVECDTGPMLLVIDDVHVLDQASEQLRILDWFIGCAPPDLHVLLSTRYPPRLPNAIAWRVRGELLEIGQDQLAFTPSEVAALFRDQYRVFLTPEEVHELTAETEGWAIALQLVWQGLRTGLASDLPQALGRLSGSAEDFFAFLAQEVLEQQPPDIQEFLLATAVLREMTVSICDCLRSADGGLASRSSAVVKETDRDRRGPASPGDSRQILDYLLESGLFVIDLGESGRLGRIVRYHHLFRDFLCQRLDSAQSRTLHRKAAVCCERHGAVEEAVHHLLAGQAFDKAAGVLDYLGREMLRAGRLEMLNGWIGSLPLDILDAHPALLVYLGDIARLHSRFDEALGWYRQAEERCRARGDARGIGRALRGQARVYLDTVNPSQAQDLLQEALRLSDGQEDRETRARLLELLAENQLNLGRAEEAQLLREEARKLREEGPGEAELAMRVLLRTGQLDRASALLAEQAQVENEDPVLRPRAHRETVLLLSFTLALQGDGQEAYRLAVEGTERGRALDSPFVTAVGTMRQGHACLLRENGQGYQEACRCYQEAIILGDTLAVPRLKVEAFLGLCRAHGFRGGLEEAYAAAQQGIEIAERAGDEWIAALIRVTMGASCALAGRYEDAADWLAHAGIAFQECGDTFGEALVCLWRSLVLLETEDAARLERSMGDFLGLVRQYNYDFLFERKTLFGPPDLRRLVPLLLFARDAGLQRTCAERLLARMGLAGSRIHPGYQLRIQTLGSFRVWRGTQKIAPDDWGREKARQILQVLLTHRGRLLHRDQIVEMLWPGSDPETGQRDFNVALSTLRRVLEPDREPRAPSAYIVRDGSLYGLRPGADLWLDANRFERLIEEGDRLFSSNPEAAIDRYQEALDCYQGEYLQECPYQDWCSEERERLLALFLRMADRMSRVLAEREEWEETIKVCRSILARDTCWEEAYRLMMTAYARLGNRTQALRVYRCCEQCLREELDVEPSPATRHLQVSLLGSTAPVELDPS
ncbi:MAG: BTAD domain-containing putative transcriptional regulator [Anaerolineae bacterium]|jgi:DNA-binding SARP family transcriptional activator